MMAMRTRSLILLGVCCCYGLTVATIGPFGGQSTTVKKTSADGDEEKDPYEAQASYDHPHYYHGDGGYGYHHHHVSYVNDDAVKGLLIPLAGIALLGAAAIAASNPLLLQIGVVGGSIGKRRRRRRRRDTSALHLHELGLLEAFLRQVPKSVVALEEKKLQASYILCSGGLGEGPEHCFERVICELSHPTQQPSSNSTATFQRRVLGVVLSDIMKNEFLPKDIKQRILIAQKMGLQRGDCSTYSCREVDYPGIQTDYGGRLRQ